MVDNDEARRRGLREMLVWALRWVAADPDAAIAPLRSPAGTVLMEPDEIALTLDDAWLPSQGQGVVSAAVESVVAEIDRVFTEISGSENAEHWTEDAVRSSTVWSDQRLRAREALELMGEPRRDADLIGRV